MRTNVIHLEETDSTNRYLRDLGPLAEDCLTVVVAGYQTAGRGQGTNSWESEPAQNLLFSVGVVPRNVPVARQFVLSEAGALAVGDALSAYTDGISLKWPNDVYWHDCKISGTLIETAVSAHGMRRCVYGIGINVNQRVFHSDAPNPVSLFQILGVETNLDEVLQRTLSALEYYLDMIEWGDAAKVSALYHDRLYRRQGLYTYEDAMGTFRAVIDHVEDDGHLVLRDETGLLRAYAFKEVRFVIGNS